MYVSVYVRACDCWFASLYACMHVCVCVCTYVGVVLAHVDKSLVHSCVPMLAYTYVCVSFHSYLCVCLHVRVCACHLITHMFVCHVCYIT